MVMNEAPASQCCERASGFGCTFEESQSASIHTELALNSRTPLALTVAVTLLHHLFILLKSFSNRPIRPVRG